MNLLIEEQQEPPPKRAKSDFREDVIEDISQLKKNNNTGMSALFSSASSSGGGRIDLLEEENVRAPGEANNSNPSSTASSSAGGGINLLVEENAEAPGVRDSSDDNESKEQPIKLGDLREPLDFRRPPKKMPVFERKSVEFSSLLQDPNYAEKATNEILLNTHAERTELGRITAKNKWVEFCAVEGRPRCVRELPPSDREITIFCGLLRCAYPQSALTYASNWKAWVESERKQSFTKMGVGAQEAYSKCATALAAAKGLPHKDAPFAPHLFVLLSKKVKGECEELVLRMAIFAFWALLRMDEFQNLAIEKTSVETRGQVQCVEEIESCRKREIQNWRDTLRSGASFEKQPFLEKNSLSSNTRVKKKTEGLKIRVKRSKTKVGDSGLSVSFFCSCAWGKQIGMKRGLYLCPVHVMDEEDFANAKLVQKSDLREGLDEIFRKIGIKNKPDGKGERRTYNLHSSRRGGAKYAIYSLGAPGISTLGRWSHRSGTAMQEYVEEALCDPVSGPVPTWPLVASTLKLIDISVL